MGRSGKTALVATHARYIYLLDNSAILSIACACTYMRNTSTVVHAKKMLAFVTLGEIV